MAWIWWNPANYTTSGAPVGSTASNPTGTGTSGSPSPTVQPISVGGGYSGGSYVVAPIKLNPTQVSELPNSTFYTKPEMPVNQPKAEISYSSKPTEMGVVTPETRMVSIPIGYNYGEVAGGYYLTPQSQQKMFIGGGETFVSPPSSAPLNISHTVEVTRLPTYSTVSEPATPRTFLGDLNIGFTQVTEYSGLKIPIRGETNVTRSVNATEKSKWFLPTAEDIGMYGKVETWEKSFGKLGGTAVADPLRFGYTSVLMFGLGGRLGGQRGGGRVGVVEPQGAAPAVPEVARRVAGLDTEAKGSLGETTKLASETRVIFEGNKVDSFQTNVPDWATTGKGYTRPLGSFESKAADLSMAYKGYSEVRLSGRTGEPAVRGALVESGRGTLDPFGEGLTYRFIAPEGFKTTGTTGEPIPQGMLRGGGTLELKPTRLDMVFDITQSGVKTGTDTYLSEFGVERTPVIRQVEPSQTMLSGTAESGMVSRPGAAPPLVRLMSVEFTAAEFLSTARQSRFANTKGDLYFGEWDAPTVRQTSETQRLFGEKRNEFPTPVKESWFYHRQQSYFESPLTTGTVRSMLQRVPSKGMSNPWAEGVSLAKTPQVLESIFKGFSGKRGQAFLSTKGQPMRADQVFKGVESKATDLNYGTISKTVPEVWGGKVKEVGAQRVALNRESVLDQLFAEEGRAQSITGSRQARVTAQRFELGTDVAKSAAGLFGYKTRTNAGSVTKINTNVGQKFETTRLSILKTPAVQMQQQRQTYETAQKQATGFDSSLFNMQLVTPITTTTARMETRAETRLVTETRRPQGSWLWRDPEPPPNKGRGGGISPFPGGAGGLFGGFSGFGSKASKRKYAPSLVGLFSGMKVSKAPNLLTGIEVRFPIGFTKARKRR